MNRGRKFVILVCAYVLTGCASTTTITPVPAPGEFIREPQAAAVRRLADSLRARGSATYSVLLRPDSAPRYRLVRTTFDDSVANAIGARLGDAPSAMRPAEPTFVMLDLEIADTVAMRTRRHVSEAPQLHNGPVLANLLGEAARGLPEGTRTTVWMFVEPSGAIAGVRITKGSGTLEYDLAVQRVARSALFTPCTIDATPVGCWVEQEFRMPYRRQ